MAPLATADPFPLPPALAAALLELGAARPPCGRLPRASLLLRPSLPGRAEVVAAPRQPTANSVSHAVQPTAGAPSHPRLPPATPSSSRWLPPLPARPEHRGGAAQPLLPSSPADCPPPASPHRLGRRKARRPQDVRRIAREMSSIVEEFFEDSSSSDDFYEDLFEDDDLEEVALIIAQWAVEGNKKSRHLGSQPGHVKIFQNRAADHDPLIHDYFADNPVYPPHLFRRRFRVSRELFVCIANAMEANERYFTRRRNAAGELGFNALQKVSAAMRVIAYGVPTNYTDEYLRIGEDTTLKSVRKFAETVIKVFGADYLRAPNTEDTAWLLAMGEARGRPGMLGSIDCMHWRWKNCPAAWHGQFTGHCRDLILEAVASEDL